MKNFSILLAALSLYGCILSQDDSVESSPGSVKVELRLDRTRNALGKIASSDTIFRMDSLYVSLSCAGQTTVNSNLGITGRADSSSIVVTPQIYSNLASLRTWKANFISVDTVFNREATAQTGSTSSTIKLDASASATDGAYTGMGIYIVSGTGSGQIRHISGYVGSTKVATVSSNWTNTPSNTSLFRIYLKDTVYIDSTTFFVKPADTANIIKTLNARYSILRVRVKSDSASLVPNAVLKLRFKVDGVVRDSVTLNSKTFDNLLTYKYLTPNTNHTLLVQAFDVNTFDRGYERTKNINIPSNKDTTIALDTIIRTGTAQGATGNTLTLDVSASATTNFYSGMIVRITSGTGVGQERIITAYNGSTKKVSVSPNWGTNPTSSSVFKVYYSLIACGRTGYSVCTP